jgi:hypothetical protein
MRIRTSWLMVVAAIAGLAACTVKSADSDNPDAGEGTGGSAGTGGTAGTGTGGSAGQTQNGACGDVPVTGKCDGNTLKMCMISDNKDNPEQVVSTDCGTNRTCQDDKANGYKTSAKCQQVGQCNAGDTSCKSSTVLLTCAGTGAATAWTETTCNAANSEQCMLGKPGTPAKCVSIPAAGTGDKVTGVIKYERRKPGTDNLSWSNVEVQEATDVYVTFYDGDTLIGRALTGYDLATNTYTYDGKFSADLDKPLTENTQMWVWAMAFNYDTGNPLMALAHSKGTSLKDNASTADQYWAWGGPVGNVTDGLNVYDSANPGTLKDYTIKEADGSGAMNIYQWVDFGLQRTATAVPGAAQMSLIVYWSPLYLPQCGACFCGTQCGGGVVTYGSGASDVDQYDSWIMLGGPASTGDETHWANGVISHEFGHYVMANYSLSPGEGGPHYLSKPSKPGLAYSEAWATSFGQSNVSTPIYVDQQEGTFFWIDLSKYESSNGAIDKPDPAGAIDQAINENIAAGMIWKLWAYPPGTTTEEVVDVFDSQGQSLGTDKIFKILTYKPLVDGQLNRGYQTVDMVDFLDAAVCSGNATDAQVKAVCDSASYPYDATARKCP